MDVKPSQPTVERNTEAVKLWAFRALAVMMIVVLAESAVIGILWYRRSTTTASIGVGVLTIPNGNRIKTTYPKVDFSKVYPGFSDADIDTVQREAFELPYIHEPFTGFKLAPAKRRTVEVVTAGFRLGANPQPWPPAPEAVNVFVFGGSTTFGYAVRNEDTFPAALQAELGRVFSNRRIECYNFGCGFYFTTQERLRFELLLATEHLPSLAVFLDGLNDFYFESGEPQFTPNIAKLFEPNAVIRPLPPPTRDDFEPAVRSILLRYSTNVRMIEAIAERWGIGVLFVGQPIPFHDFPRTKQSYPFMPPVWEHGLANLAYGHFRRAGLAGEFGPSFLWCGDAFVDAYSMMYADSIHYSPEGNRVLARVIVERAKARGLLKF